MDISSDAAAMIALGAALGALLALVVALVVWLKVRRVRSAQLVLLGGGKSDLIDFAVSLQARIDDLHRAVDEIAAGLSRVHRRVHGSLGRTAVGGYDAYGGPGCPPSASDALRDSAPTRLGVRASQMRRGHA